MVLAAWILGGLMVFVLGLSYYGSLEMTRIPYFAVPYTPTDFGWDCEEVSFPSEDGLRLTGWFVPASGQLADGDPSGQPLHPKGVRAHRASAITLIVQHGIGSNHGDMLQNTACLVREGRLNLLYYNFRGHGDSQGRLTSLGPLELLDLAGALRFLREKKPHASRRLGIYGHSLGAAVAIVGAARFKQLEAVAAESPFASISQTVRLFARIYHGIPYFPYVPLAIFFASLRLRLRLGQFNPVEAISQIAPRPVFLIQGGRDLRIPMSDFQKLWAAAREPKERWLVPGADHGDPWLMDREEYEKRLVGFFKRTLIEKEVAG
ncbi:MAG: hypothetical protein A3J70_05965 [Elusimicrobia bacterium RIFCSPHIGHO2_02_FULL_61_10]|nr:MAG: hypothetical protein A3J70_05965 [Elusimicrobia bacterium RIFCSPHIGHO2_02_FULL_61_10]